MNPVAEELAATWKRDFWAANHEITWTAIEEERYLWLDRDTLLVGKVDAQGLTSDGDKFFGEWKTKSGFYAGKRMAEVKTTWRTAPQALTYGVLVPNTRRFTVRWALKSSPPQTDFEWYSYTDAEIAHWTRQLIDIADDIRFYHNRIKHAGREWRTNRGDCYRYGVKYACPFLNSCHALDFNASMGSPRQPHTELEKQIRAGTFPGMTPTTVVISSSRVGDYLSCPERYRRAWEGEGFHEENENLEIGSDFHQLVGEHLTSLIVPSKIETSQGD
jgi:hypothetical protein